MTGLKKKIEYFIAFMSVWYDYMLPLFCLSFSHYWALHRA